MASRLQKISQFWPLMVHMTDKGMKGRAPKRHYYFRISAYSIWNFVCALAYKEPL